MCNLIIKQAHLKWVTGRILFSFLLLSEDKVFSCKIRFSLIIYHNFIVFTTTYFGLVLFPEDGQQWINDTLFFVRHPATSSHLHFCRRRVVPFQWNSPVCSNMCLSHSSVFKNLFMIVCHAAVSHLSQLTTMDLSFILSFFFFLIIFLWSHIWSLAQV